MKGIYQALLTAAVYGFCTGYFSQFFFADATKCPDFQVDLGEAAAGRGFDWADFFCVGPGEERARCAAVGRGQAFPIRGTKPG
ncbi:hypothetical protein CJF39_13020 [Pseudomonas lundensis]|uniref:Uncharacterized protein n=1 Tax=Pseudomonas lundensis TaxID=86185 RepID=A0A266N939_9PSED|nr:hypothetical protein CJF39_13020 [Pseudomonas lundensis]